jgi:hypothetical protein
MIAIRPVSTIQSRLLRLVAQTAAIVLIAALAIGCGAKTGTRTKHGSTGLIVTPAARTSSPIVLPRVFPGRPLGSLSLRRSELVRSSARFLLSSADGSLSLIAGRSRMNHLCAGAVAPPSGDTAIRCLSDGERPPLIGFVSVTGPPRTSEAVSSMSVVGLADPATTRVVVELQDLSRKSVKLRRLPGLPWRTFSAGPYENTSPDPSLFEGLPTSLIALDRNGRQLGEVDLGFTYPDCDTDVCPHPKTKTGNWVTARDPIASQQSAEVSPAREQLAKRLLLSNVAVKQITSGRQFSLSPVTAWSKCNGELIGVTVPVLLTDPVSIEGELPLTGYQDGTGHAYLEGRVYYRIENVHEIDVSIDLNRKLVVSVDPLSMFDLSSGSEPVVKEMRPVGELYPAGGPDTANCGSNGD